MKVRHVWVGTRRNSSRDRSEGAPEFSGFGTFVSAKVRPGRIAKDVRRLLEQHAVPCLQLSIGDPVEQPSWMTSPIDDLDREVRIQEMLIRNPDYYDPWIDF